MKKYFDRHNQIRLALLIIFLILAGRLANLTITNGEYYSEKSLYMRIKDIPEIAKRGEILDRNGNLLAGNIAGFNVTITEKYLPGNQFNEVAIELIDLLDERGESHIEFPIIVENGIYRYRYDIAIEKWLYANGYTYGTTAEEVFNTVRVNELIHSELDVYEAQSILLAKGISVPITVKHMKFREELNKDNFLKSYGLEVDLSAEEAFNEIRAMKSFKIPDELSDEDAYKIMILRHAIKSKGYYKYEPIEVASNISKDTAIFIEEKALSLPGVFMDVEPIRSYPYKTVAAHILGYLGKISSESEVEKYINQNGYNTDQMIGKTGIEGSYEDELTGENGYRYIEVDALGKLVRNVEDGDYEAIVNKPSVSGEDVQLTIDVDLQIVTENSLAYAIEQIQKGEPFESPWGDYNYDAFPKAETGAAVVVDVKNGEVLAMASYPTYDNNLFSTGISTDDWNALNPVNKRNPLAPRPLYNIATMSTVQPGSAYKMMTGYAALEVGLNPNKKIYSDGFVEIGNNIYGCWYWNDYRARHGYIDLYQALEMSCNYYFFDVANGFDYSKNKSLGFDMNWEKMVESSKKFGLDEKTGVEITEVSRGVPNVNKKKNTTLYYLKNRLIEEADVYFPSHIVKDEDRLISIADEVLSWADENPYLETIIRRLMDIGEIEDYNVAYKLGNKIKYDYFNFIKYNEGDTLNLAIGQGDHEYTPAQIARYVMTIANGGYNYELSLVKQVGDVPMVKNLGIDNEEFSEDLLADIRQGMFEAANGSRGTSRKIFGENFPILTGGKTGTAQKQGKIPPIDEVEYLLTNLSKMTDKVTEEMLEERTLEILIERNETFYALNEERGKILDEIKSRMEYNGSVGEMIEVGGYNVEETELLDSYMKVSDKISDMTSGGYLNKDSAMRTALKDLMRNPETGETISDEQINEFRNEYDSYGWYVSFAPYDDPEIAVVVLIPQGGHGSYGAPVARDIMAKYFELEPPVIETEAN